jgi:FixJ family two-component response regulator
MSRIGQHVFVVDNEPAVCKAVARTLGELNIKISCFFSAEDCLAHLKKQDCHLLITDLKMPEMDGIQLLTKARLIAPWLPVLIITGYGDIPTAVKAVQMGASNFIEKPLQRETFLHTVRALLDKGARMSEMLGRSLTRAEIRVLRFVLAGKSSKEIASILHRSLRTIELHRQHIMRKLGVNNVVELVNRIAEMDLGELSKDNPE